MKSGFLLVVCSNLLCHIYFGHGSHHVQGDLELDQKKLNSEDRKPVNDEQMNEGKVAACETTVGDKQPKEGHSDFFVTNESNSAGVFQTAPTRTFNHGHSKASKVGGRRSTRKRNTHKAKKNIPIPIRLTYF